MWYFIKTPRGIFTFLKVKGHSDGNFTMAVKGKILFLNHLAKSYITLCGLCSMAISEIVCVPPRNWRNIPEIVVGTSAVYGLLLVRSPLLLTPIPQIAGQPMFALPNPECTMIRARAVNKLSTPPTYGNILH